MVHVPFGPSFFGEIHSSNLRGVHLDHLYSKRLLITMVRKFHK